jgi:putative acetyltransferase
MDIIIRAESPEDYPRTRQINIEAFGGETEANIIETLRDIGIVIISLVPEIKDEVVGQILFSPVDLESHDSTISIAGLGPMAIAPEHQRKAIGSKLVEEGLHRCEKAGFAAVVVLGHPEYYPRFGFIPSVKHGIKSEYDVPDEVFMVKKLHEGALAYCRGTIKYHGVFNQP